MAVADGGDRGGGGVSASAGVRTTGGAGVRPGFAGGAAHPDAGGPGREVHPCDAQGGAGAGGGSGRAGGGRSSGDPGRARARRRHPALEREAADRRGRRDAQRRRLDARLADPNASAPSSPARSTTASRRSARTSGSIRSRSWRWRPAGPRGGDPSAAIPVQGGRSNHRLKPPSSSLSRSDGEGDHSGGGFRPGANLGCGGESPLHRFAVPLQRDGGG